MPGSGSPWYLGAWWPDAQPAFFFAQARVGEPYRSVVFDPRNRIPLYQAVFHDALIGSHHWHSDNLTLSEVKNTRTLLSGLYNTAPMYHLNRAALAARLPEMRKTDAIFRPLHAVPWNKALTGFRWLDAARPFSPGLSPARDSIIFTYVRNAISGVNHCQKGIFLRYFLMPPRMIWLIVSSLAWRSSRLFED